MEEFRKILWIVSDLHSLFDSNNSAIFGKWGHGAIKKRRHRVNPCFGIIENLKGVAIYCAGEH